MKLTDDVHLIASGKKGFGITDALDCHVYLIDGGGELALIDAGAGRDTEGLLQNVRAAGYSENDVKHILLTHAHADHSAGAAALRARLGARVCLSQAEAGFLETADEAELGLAFARQAGVYPPDYGIAPCPVDAALAHGAEIAVGSLRLTAISVRGHSRGSICYLVDGREGRYLFSGDTVFCDGLVSLLNCAGSGLADYREDITRLGGLGVDALLPGHLRLCLHGGQDHIDEACTAFRSLSPPGNIA